MGLSCTHYSAYADDAQPFVQPRRAASGVLVNTRLEPNNSMPIAFDALDSQLKEASAQIAQSRKRIQRDPPQMLFHYTNAKGLLGIVDSGRLWATNYRFLNDTSEISYAMALFETIVKERLSKPRSEVVAEFLKRAFLAVNAFDGMFDCYVACFCEKDDLLNQWRAYAASGGGFSVGLHSREIGMRMGRDKPGQDFILRKVEYEEAAQRQLLAEVLDLTAGHLEKSTEGHSVADGNNAIARCCQFIRAEAAEYLACFKHPAFSVEEEWRLCHVTGPSEETHVLFREGAYGLTPYVELDPSPMAGVNTNRIPISRITHSPTKDATNVRFALSKLLRSTGYSFVEISGSTLPLRAGL